MTVDPAAGTTPTLVVPVDDLARLLGLVVTDTDVRWRVEQAILAAQTDVEAHLGRPIVPVEHVERELWGHGEGFYVRNGPVAGTVSAVAELDTGGAPTGAYTVTYRAGLDAAADPTLAPVRRYVAAHAANSPVVLRIWADQVPSARPVTNVSVEGQSISYGQPSLGGGGQPGSGWPGALPALSSLDRWRVAGRRVFTRGRDGRRWLAPWPAGP